MYCIECLAFPGNPCSQRVHIYPFCLMSLFAEALQCQWTAHGHVQQITSFTQNWRPCVSEEVRKAVEEILIGKWIPQWQAYLFYQLQKILLSTLSWLLFLWIAILYWKLLDMKALFSVPSGKRGLHPAYGHFLPKVYHHLLRTILDFCGCSLHVKLA